MDAVGNILGVGSAHGPSLEAGEDFGFPLLLNERNGELNKLVFLSSTFKIKSRTSSGSRRSACPCRVDMGLRAEYDTLDRFWCSWPMQD